MAKILLASSSKFRSHLLDSIGLLHITASPNTDEIALPNKAPKLQAARLSLGKALALKDQYPDYLIIGSDQVAVCDGKILHKPGTHTNAIQQLKFASGKNALFHTGICLLNTTTGEHQLTVNTTAVSYRPLSEQEIESYLTQDMPYQCAGSFKSEGLGISILNKIEGTDPNALVGLPLIDLLSMLRKENINPLLESI